MREPTPSSAWEDAARYDRWYDTPLGAFVLAHELAAVQHLVTPQAGELVLEVGCGTGRFSLALAASGATVVGVDAFASAITYAAQHTPQGAHVRYVVADTEQLPFADDAFDVVVCILALEFIAHPPTAVAELRRVLKPSGRLVIGVLGRWSPWNLWRRLRGAMGHPLW